MFLICINGELHPNSFNLLHVHLDSMKLSFPYFRVIVLQEQNNNLVCLSRTVVLNVGFANPRGSQEDFQGYLDGS